MKIRSQWVTCFTFLTTLTSSQLFSESVLARPAMGVYEAAGCDGAANALKYKTWLGKPAEHLVDFMEFRNGYAGMAQASSWAAWCWQQAGIQGSNMTFTVPPTVTDKTLEATNAGEGDEHYRAMARDFVAKGFGNSVIRIGHEMNGNWYPWAAKNHEAAYTAAFRRIVEIFRSVPGARFKFNWCVSGGEHASTDYASMYPGDGYVDIIGMDVYGTTDWGSSDAQVWGLMRDNYSLAMLVSMGKAHNKQIAVDEWGLGNSDHGNGSGDRPQVMKWMLEYMESNTVLYANYWDFNGGGYNSMMRNGDFPQQGAVYRDYIHSPKAASSAIINMFSGKALDLPDFGNGTRVQQYSYWGGENQKFILKSVGPNLQILAAGSDDSQPLCLEVKDWSTFNEAHVGIWSCPEIQNNQLWHTVGGNGVEFQLRNVHSGKCLDLERDSSGKTNTSDFGKLVQRDCDSTSRSQIFNRQ